MKKARRSRLSEGKKTVCAGLSCPVFYRTAQSDAKRLLLPFKNCGNVIVGVSDNTPGSLIQQAIEELRKFIA